jgi:hypothetical protein
MESAGAEAFGDPVGALLLRGIDNDHLPSLLRAKGVLGSDAAARERISILKANKAAHAVVYHLRDQRCPKCKGNRYERTDLGAQKACIACNASGFMVLGKDHWTHLHYQVLSDALARIGRHLQRCRAQLERD